MNDLKKYIQLQLTVKMKDYTICMGKIIFIKCNLQQK